MSEVHRIPVKYQDETLIGLYGVKLSKRKIFNKGVRSADLTRAVSDGYAK